MVRDLHQGTFDADEDAIEVGVRLLVGAALCETVAQLAREQPGPVDQAGWNSGEAQP